MYYDLKVAKDQQEREDLIDDNTPIINNDEISFNL